MNNFALGQIVATPAALEVLAETGETVEEFVGRHARLEQGNLGDDDHALNAESVKSKGLILSSFNTKNDKMVWVITDPGHAVTTVLLPSDY